jgi:F-type H+-transporting ATPase subunit beta
MPAAEEATYRRGERLEAFLTQPLYVAEPYTKRAGEFVSLAESLEGVRRILDGQVDEIAVESLLYVGALPR